MRLRKVAIGTMLAAAALVVWGLLAPRTACGLSQQVRIFALIGFLGTAAIGFGTAIFLAVDDR